MPCLDDITIAPARQRLRALKRIAEQIALQLPDHRGDALMVLEYAKEIVDWRTAATESDETRSNVIRLGGIAGALLLGVGLEEANALADMAR
jgi:hypothetical protein